MKFYYNEAYTKTMSLTFVFLLFCFSVKMRLRLVTVAILLAVASRGYGRPSHPGKILINVKNFFDPD